MIQGAVPTRDQHADACHLFLSPCLQALEASPILNNILRGEAGLADMSAQIPAVARECEELLVWKDFYQLEGYANPRC